MNNWQKYFLNCTLGTCSPKNLCATKFRLKYPLLLACVLAYREPLDMNLAPLLSDLISVPKKRNSLSMELKQFQSLIRSTSNKSYYIFGLGLVLHKPQLSLFAGGKSVMDHVFINTMTPTSWLRQIQIILDLKVMFNKCQDNIVNLFVVATVSLHTSHVQQDLFSIVWKMFWHNFCLCL